MPPKETSFITQDPIDIITSGNYNKIPVLIGYCKDEGIFTEVILTRVKKQIAHEDFEALIHHKLGLVKGTTASKDIALKIKNFYYPDQKVDIDPIQAFYDVRNVISHDILILRICSFSWNQT